MATQRKVKINIRTVKDTRRRMLYGGPHDNEVVEMVGTMAVFAKYRLRPWSLHEEIVIGETGRVIYYARDVYVAIPELVGSAPSLSLFAVTKEAMESFEEKWEVGRFKIEIPQRIVHVQEGEDPPTSNAEKIYHLAQAIIDDPETCLLHMRQAETIVGLAKIIGGELGGSS